MGRQDIQRMKLNTDEDAFPYIMKKRTARSGKERGF